MVRNSAGNAAYTSGTPTCPCRTKELDGLDRFYATSPEQLSWRVLLGDTRTGGDSRAASFEDSLRASPRGADNEWPQKPHRGFDLDQISHSSNGTRNNGSTRSGFCSVGAAWVRSVKTF